MWAFAHSSWLRRRTAVRSRPQWGRRASRWSFPETVSDSLSAEILSIMQTDCCRSCPRLFSDDLQGEDAGCRGSLAGVVTLGLWLWGQLDVRAKFSETPLETAYGREMNFQFMSNSSGGHSCCQNANCTAPSKLVTFVALCCVIKLHILECSFIVASLRHTCAIIMLSNQHLDMPHLWGGWIILAKEKCSLTQI